MLENVFMRKRRDRRYKNADGFLRELLKNGAIDALDVLSIGSSFGLSPSTIYRAKKRCAVISKKKDLLTGWRWELTQT